MKYRRELVPVLFLASGAALTVCGLAIMVAYGTRAPIAAAVILLAGLLDGVAGLIWTLAMLFSRRGEAAGDAGAMETQRTFVLAGGLLAVVFLGAVLAILLYLHVIVACLRGWQVL
jgi:formate-dependent nitrite reductase membrane component NrfD